MTDEVHLRLPPRPADGHKGTFGSVLVVGGCMEPRRMLGGPALAATAAMRAGCGLCELAMPAPMLDAALSIVPVATGVPLPTSQDGQLVPDLAGPLLDEAIARATAVAIGPGLGGGSAIEILVEKVLLAARLQGRPIVVDADGLNAIARRPPPAPWPRLPPTIVTPHVGEFRRLADAVGIDGGDPAAAASRPAAAAALATRLGAVVVLKGAGTVICDGPRHVVNSTGNAALATGGSGDVLTGTIAGLVASWFATTPEHPVGAAFDAATAAVWAHGRTAERAVERLARGRSAGILASDLLEEIPGALAEASHVASRSK